MTRPLSAPMSIARWVWIALIMELGRIGVSVLEADARLFEDVHIGLDEPAISVKAAWADACVLAATIEAAEVFLTFWKRPSHAEVSFYKQFELAIYSASWEMKW